MKIVGVIAEYNPFHNGHLYHLKKVREKTNANVVIAVITGYFSMRGTPSTLNIADKTRIALNYGVDIVILLPYLLATNNADLFSYYSVYMLNKLGVEEIVSGSETNEIGFIEKIATLESDAHFQNNIRAELQKGNSYRKAYTNALNNFKIPSILSNDLLNVKYLEAIKKINPEIKLTLIQRINNNYLDKEINNSNVQSATAIRELQNISAYVPHETNDLFITKGFYQYNAFTPILRHQIITNDLKKLFAATEGIENQFTSNFHDIDSLLKSLTSKRYTTSRISRFISYIITNTTPEEMQKAKENPPVRVLGFNQIGQAYLHQIKKDHAYFSRLVFGIHSVYDKEIILAKIFSNVYNEDFIKMEQELPIIIK